MLVPDSLDDMRGRLKAFTHCVRAGSLIGHTCFFVDPVRTRPGRVVSLPSGAEGPEGRADRTPSGAKEPGVPGTLRIRRNPNEAAAGAALPAPLRCAKKVVAGAAPRAGRGPPGQAGKRSFGVRGLAIGG